MCCNRPCGLGLREQYSYFQIHTCNYFNLYICPSLRPVHHVYYVMSLPPQYRSQAVAWYFIVRKPVKNYLFQNLVWFLSSRWNCLYSSTCSLLFLNSLNPSYQKKEIRSFNWHYTMTKMYPTVCPIYLLKWPFLGE